MTVTPPIRRILFAELEVGRYRHDVEEPAPERDASASDRDGWAWKDLVAKANFLFGRILDLDLDVQELVLDKQVEWDPLLDTKVRAILGEWLRVSLQFLPRVGRFESEHGPVEGAKELRENVNQATSILTPDHEFFGGEKLAELRDEAIEAHRTGGTEPFHPVRITTH